MNNQNPPSKRLSFVKPLEQPQNLAWIKNSKTETENALAEWLTIKQVATELKLHTNTIYSMVKRGDLEAFRYNRRVIRIKRTALEALMTRYKAGEFGLWENN